MGDIKGPLRLVFGVVAGLLAIVPVKLVKGVFELYPTAIYLLYKQKNEPTNTIWCFQSVSFGILAAKYDNL